MLNIGIIGLNEGNDHPYSVAAMFNGYDEAALPECPNEVIRQYLPAVHRNEHIIPDARVSHIWTQDRDISARVARVSKIAHIVDRPEDLIGEVDAVILARDDVHNHWKMARPFIEKGIPIYVDKLLAHNMEDLNKFIEMTGDDYPILSGSGNRYATYVEEAKQELGDTNCVRTIHGVSCINWLRYASHLVDPICAIFGSEVETVQNLGREGFDVVHIVFTGGPQAVLQVIADLSLPIQFTCFCRNRPGHHTVELTDKGRSSYFMGFYRLFETFTAMARTGKPQLAFREIKNVTRVIIAGEISRAENNRKVYLDELE